MTSDHSENLLRSAERAFLTNDKRTGLSSLLLIFKEDFTNESAWKMLHKVMGGGKAFDAFQMEITEKYFPDKVSLLYEKQLDSLMMENGMPAEAAPQPVTREPVTPNHPYQGPVAHNVPRLFCVHCGSEVFAVGSFCPTCGKAITQRANPQPQPQPQPHYQSQQASPYSGTNPMPNPGQFNNPFGQGSHFQPNYSPAYSERSTGSFWGAFFAVLIVGLVTTFVIGFIAGFTNPRDLENQMIIQAIGNPLALFLSGLAVKVSRNISKKKAMWATFIAIIIQFIATAIIAPEVIEDTLYYYPGLYFFTLFAGILMGLWSSWLASRKNGGSVSSVPNPAYQAAQHNPVNAQSQKYRPVPQSNSSSGFNLKNAFAIGLGGFFGSVLGFGVVSGSFAIGAGVGGVAGIFGFILGGLIAPKQRN